MDSCSFVGENAREQNKRQLLDCQPLPAGILAISVSLLPKLSVMEARCVSSASLTSCQSDAGTVSACKNCCSYEPNQMQLNTMNQTRFKKVNFHVVLLNPCIAASNLSFKGSAGREHGQHNASDGCNSLCIGAAED